MSLHILSTTLSFSGFHTRIPQNIIRGLRIHNRRIDTHRLRFALLLPPDSFRILRILCQRICAKIEGDVMGRMLEDIVLGEAIRAIPYRRDKYKQRRVFKLVFPQGEFDMAIYDPEDSTCRLYEVKHTAERDDGQLRHLVDAEKLAFVERNYGDILSRTVLYRGGSFSHPTGVRYENVGRWLKSVQKHLSKKSGETK